MGYYLDIKKNEILPCATTWMDLEDITFCKTNQGETNTLLSLMWNLKNKQTNNECNKTNRLTDTENKLAVTNSEMQWGTIVLICFILCIFCVFLQRFSLRKFWF